MKYVLLFVETEQFNSDMAAMSPSERERAYDRVNEWFAKLLICLSGLWV